MGLGTRRAAWAAGAAAFLSLAVMAWARASGVSVRAKLINDVALPLSGMKRRARDARNLHDAIARHRRVEPARPSARLRRKFVIEETIWCGAQVFTVHPRTAWSGTTILYLHGGAWVFDVLVAHWWIIEALVDRTGARVVLPRYPLAPECTWRDTYGFLDRLLTTHLATERERLIVAGDSAGGCLSLGIAQRLQERGETRPAGLVLFSPALDLTLSDPRVGAIAPHDPMLALPGCREAVRLWATGTPLDDPRISPLSGPVDGLPPLAVFTGTRDLLHPDALRLRDRIADAGGTVAFFRYPGMCHVFVGTPTPEARRALDQAGAFIRACASARRTQIRP
ncbi:alpha/beta hydrolase fold domain-containing protein [Methylobacterium sp. P31]